MGSKDRAGMLGRGGYRGRVPFRRLRPAALVAILALILAACSAPAKHQATVTPAPSTSASATANALASQDLEWTTCEQGECATARVPLDYAEPDGPTIGIALARAKATGGDRIGSLLINFGGPGGSGVDSMDMAKTMTSKDVQSHYDLVVFDPRGVQHSEPPVTCVSDEELDKITAFDADYSTPEGIAEAEDIFAGFSAACLKNTGPVFGHVDTISAARDMDILRSALGDAKLYYLGYSYGTFLGTTYANLYPQNVGRLVLDGAIDPTLDSDESALGQAVGFENALRSYVKDCQTATRCPLPGNVETGLTRIRALLDRAKTAPLQTGTSRRLTQSLAFTGIAVTLYDEGSWSYLTQALTLAIKESDGSGLLFLSDVYYDRGEDGVYGDNSTEAFWSVGCLDDRSSSDPAVMAASAKEIVAAAPTVGSFFTYGGTLCAKWSVPEVGGLDDYSAPGADPILVVGTTGDPATPYVQAKELTNILSSGHLLTYDGEGHGAYGRSNQCVTDNVDAYLIEGDLPADGTAC